ncbi:MAG TPA: hypothetical protein VF143_03395 [Candidatus Nanopelagicales bacterium]
MLALPGVAESAERARAAVDALLWDRAVGRAQAEVAAESALRGAWANAWFEGAESGLPELRSGAALDGSPVGRVLANAVALQSALPELVPVIGSAPAQALARMHALAAHGFMADAELGRPRAAVVADDPLRLGRLPATQEVAERLAGAGQLLVSSTAPGVLVAAIVHAEVAALRPFPWGSGLVARVLLRLVLAQRGVDPGMLGCPELGLRMVGRPAYVRALRGYMDGTPEGVAGFVALMCRAVAVGAGEPAGWVPAA